MVKKTTKKRAVSKKQAAKAQLPTLHGLMISRTFNGTVVRGLTFAILVLGFVLVGVASTDTFTGYNALSVWFLITLLYLVFDIIYVVLSKVRPLHPRLDRAILPGALVFSLAAIFSPIVFTTGMGMVGTWILALIILTCVIGVRFILLLLSAR